MEKKILLLTAVALLICAGFFVRHLTSATPVAARTVKLVVRGPDGERFSGSFAADGITNALAAVAPATISFPARNVDFEFRREGGGKDGAEFRVELSVGSVTRLSTVAADHQQGVRGALRYSALSESVWGGGF